MRLASLEAYVPLGKQLSLSGEAWIGDDVRLLEGALWQPPRLDPATGRHRALRSAGGWVQAALQASPAVELRLLAGTDEALANLSWGRPIGDAAPVHRNRIVAANATWRRGPVAFGLQLHAVRTSYAGEAPGTLLGATVTSQLKF